MCRKITSIVLTFLMLVSVVPTTALDTIKEKISKKTTNQMLDIVEQFSKYRTVDEAELADGTLIVGTSNNEKIGILYTTYLPNGKVIYQYYDALAEVMHSLTSRCDLKKVSNQQAVVIENESKTTDVAAWRRKNTEVVHITDEEEDDIREALYQSDRDVNKAIDELRKAGMKDISMTRDAEGNIYVEKQSSATASATSAASATACNPAKKTAKQYAPPYTDVLKASGAKYHSGLKQTIKTKVLQSADDYTQKNAVRIFCESGIDIVVAAVGCFTTTGWFTGVLSFYGIATSLNKLNENIQYMSEVYWTYNAEKSGWAYDYVTPNAAGRKNGYVRIVPNTNTGKITLGWDGTGKNRTNFKWSQTVDVKSYDVPNTEILDKAFNLYTARIVSYGFWD